MKIRKHVVDGIEYNLLTDEELEELLYVAALKKECDIARQDIEKNYISLEEFERRGKELYGL